MFKNDLTGKKFGRLTVLGFSHKDVKKYRKSDDKPFQTKYLWKCRCNCGNITLVASSNLISGNTKSCGCLKKEIREFRKVDSFIFPVLDTSNETIVTEYEKLLEEIEELKEAILVHTGSIEDINKNKENLIEESFDVIQVIINLLDKLGISSKDKQEAYKKHVEKMIERGWDVKTYM